MFPDLLRDDVFRLETARLWLRWPRLADAAALSRLAGDAELAAMTASVPHPYTQADAARWIFASRSGNAAGQSLVLLLAPRRRPNEAIGAIGLHETRPGVGLLGFWLGRAHQGKGLMGEAAAALVDTAFRLGDVDQIFAQARIENEPSRRLLERLGFVSTGRGPIDLPARGGVFICERFALARRDWARAREKADEAPTPSLAAAG